jgi:hypothetical protein
MDSLPDSPARTGRLVGILLLVQLAGLIVPFILLHPITSTAFLGTAAASAPQLRTAVGLLFANAALTMAIATLAFHTLRTHGYGMALWLLSASVLWFMAQATDNAHILSMVSLSQRYTTGGGANAELFEALAGAARSTRIWIHYTALLLVETWFLVFYAALYRAALVPRLLALLGVAMVLLHAVSVTLPAFVGFEPTPMLAPSLAVSHVAIGAWLIAKGFPVQARTT